MTGEKTQPRLRPTSFLVLVMAVSTGMAVANIWYAQPLLNTLARAFGVGNGTAGFIVTMTQLGYAAGLALFVPLGDLVEQRRLIVVMSVGTALALFLAAAAPGLDLFLAASLLIGVTAVVAQVLVPMAAHLAADHERGRVVGRVMAGLLLGILLARTVSGYVSDALSWRAVFWLAGAWMMAQALILWRMLPRRLGETRLPYRALLGSVLALFREEPLLRRRCVYGAVGMASFSALWTALSFLLAGPPYHYSNTVIGLFGILGAAGAVCAMLAGRLHDAGGTRLGTGFFLALLVVSFVLMGLFGRHLGAIIAGIVLLDLGQQGQHIMNQSVIYDLRPDARSRVTTVYMTCFFFGGVVGSAGATCAYQLAQWPGVAALGEAVGTAGFLFWLTELTG